MGKNNRIGTAPGLIDARRKDRGHHWLAGIGRTAPEVKPPPPTITSVYTRILDEIFTPETRLIRSVPGVLEIIEFDLEAVEKALIRAKYLTPGRKIIDENGNTVNSITILELSTLLKSKLSLDKLLHTIKHSIKMPKKLLKKAKQKTKPKGKIKFQ